MLACDILDTLVSGKAKIAETKIEYNSINFTQINFNCFIFMYLTNSYIVCWVSKLWLFIQTANQQVDCCIGIDSIFVVQSSSISSFDVSFVASYMGTYIFIKKSLL
jgi:hypothetical protein